jgi:hypothetical protein
MNANANANANAKDDERWGHCASCRSCVETTAEPSLPHCLLLLLRLVLGSSLKRRLRFQRKSKKVVEEGRGDVTGLKSLLLRIPRRGGAFFHQC